MFGLLGLLCPGRLPREVLRVVDDVAAKGDEVLSAAGRDFELHPNATQRLHVHV